MRKFAFFYFIVAESGNLAQVIPEHVQYWDAHHSPGYIGGPFVDRSGGLIVFEAEDLSSAEAIVRNDPFVEEKLFAQSWLKEWGANIGPGRGRSLGRLEVSGADRTQH